MTSTLIPMIPCARSCALSPNGDLMAAGFDNGDLRVRVILELWIIHMDEHNICIICVTCSRKRGHFPLNFRFCIRHYLSADITQRVVLQK